MTEEQMKEMFSGMSGDQLMDKLVNYGRLLELYDGQDERIEAISRAVKVLKEVLIEKLLGLA